MSGSARGGAEHLARIHGTEEDKVRSVTAVFVVKKQSSHLCTGELLFLQQDGSYTV